MLISANSLITVYIGVELLALSLYAMVAFDRESGIAAEAAMKYFVLGALASGTLLYGMSIVYGLTGTLDLEAIATQLHSPTSLGVILGLAFIVVAVGLQARRGAVPHVAAGRLRGRADQRDDVHRHGAQDRLFRAGAAPARARPRRYRGRLDA